MSRTQALRRRVLAPLVPVLAVAIAAAITGCTVTTNDHREKQDVNETTVDWDVAEATAIDRLGSPIRDGELTRQTPGEDGLTVTLALPSGGAVTGAWSRAIASSDDDGTVTSIELTTSAEEEEAVWRARVDDFTDRFGGDRAEIEAYLAEVIPKVEGGGGDTGRTFPGDAADGYQPELEILPRGGGEEPVAVVVGWSFDLTA